MNRNFEKRAVWSWSTRLFHWLLACLVLAAWYLGYFLDFDTINRHFYLGYGIGALLLFRIVTGFFGPKDARFRGLVFHPGKLIAYIRTIGERTPSGSAGHNPLGALSVIALLSSLSVQVISGLCSEADALFQAGPLVEGPLAEALGMDISTETVLWMTSIHYYNSRILIALIGLHLCAILYYAIWKRENLVIAMISGNKLVKSESDEQ